MTLRELRRMSTLGILSDKDMPIWDPIRGLPNAQAGQRFMERRYPRHRIIRQSALKYFRNKYKYVYPRGIGVQGTGTCLDFAFLRGNQLVFVECLTEYSIDSDTIRKKRAVEKYAPLYFIVEDKPKSEFDTPKRRMQYLRYVFHLSRHFIVFWCNPITKQIRRVRHK